MYTLVPQVGYNIGVYKALYSSAVCHLITQARVDDALKLLNTTSDHMISHGYTTKVMFSVHYCGSNSSCVKNFKQKSRAVKLAN